MFLLPNAMVHPHIQTPYLVVVVRYFITARRKETNEVFKRTAGAVRASGPDSRVLSVMKL